MEWGEFSRCENYWLHRILIMQGFRTVERTIQIFVRWSGTLSMVKKGTHNYSYRVCFLITNLHIDTGRILSRSRLCRVVKKEP